MKAFTIPSHKDIYNQLETLVIGNGLVLILGSNQNRTHAASIEAINVITPRYRKKITDEILFTVGEKDQYTDQWDPSLKNVAIAEITPNMVIFAGAIRSAEKAQLVLAAAEICPVVAIMHLTETGDPVTSAQSRLADMNCDLKKVESVLKAVLQTES